jgi:uncharacterized protein
VIVNESGASVYSASPEAIEEFPDLDVTTRGAISIGRRLQDPLAELVKVEPKSIGVGQYQHDVNQGQLKKSLDEVVESCVNQVGVDLNSASASLLSYVAGISKPLAKNIVKHRDLQGTFRTRKALLSVTQFGPKAFEQAAGFLRIAESENPLDNSAVHPENYELVQKIAADKGVELKALIGNGSLLKEISVEAYISETVGAETLKDIIAELEKPNRDPRSEFKYATFSEKIQGIQDLITGSWMEGIVTNVTNFGAFVDIGVHQDGLVHVSEIGDKFVKDAKEVLKVGDVVKVRVVAVDTAQKRIALSMKSEEAAERQAAARQGGGQGGFGGGPRGEGRGGYSGGEGRAPRGEGRGQGQGGPGAGRGEGRGGYGGGDRGGQRPAWGGQGGRGGHGGPQGGDRKMQPTATLADLKAKFKGIDPRDQKVPDVKPVVSIKQLMKKCK